MASTAGLIANTVQAPSAESNNAALQSHRGGPRNRNRNRNKHGNQEGTTPQHSRGKGGRSRGRGDFGMHALNLQDRNGKADSSAQPGPDLLPGSDNRGHLTKDPTTIEGEVSAKENQSEAEAEEDEEADVCFICASPVAHGSVSPCNHWTCHICALRLRALYKTTACAHCRVSGGLLLKLFYYQ